MKLEFAWPLLNLGLPKRNLNLLRAKIIKMSVIARKRNESRFEPIYQALQIREELTLLRNRNFGIVDICRFARSQYQNGFVQTADPTKYILYLAEVKTKLDTAASLIEVNLKAANSIYAVTISDWDRRTIYQNNALFQIELILNEMQNLVKIFNTDINSFKVLVLLLNEDRRLIHKWIKSDIKRKNKIRV